MDEGGRVRRIISRARRRGGEHIKARLIELHDFARHFGWDVKEYAVDEYAEGAGLRIAHDSFLSVLFTTQTDSLREHVQSVDLVSGFFQRVHPVFGFSPYDEDFTIDQIPDPEYPEDL